MQITNKQLYARLASLERVFSYKRIKSIDTSKLPSIAKKTFESLAFRPKMDFVLKNYVELANLISSGIVSVRTIDLYFLGEFIKNNKFPDISEFNNMFKLRDVIGFYNASSITEQIKRIIKTSEEHNTQLAKFTKTNKSVFELRDNQTNILYDMLVKGEISIYVYAYFMKNNKFTIDFSKIKDLTIYRNNKIAEYVSNFKLDEILI